MTLMHPARTGSPVAVWFSDGEPVRLVSGDTRYRVTGDPKAALINGTRYWRVRARAEDGSTGILDIRETAGGWTLVGVEDDADADSA